MLSISSDNIFHCILIPYNNQWLMNVWSFSGGPLFCIDYLKVHSEVELESACLSG